MKKGWATYQYSSDLLLRLLGVVYLLAFYSISSQIHGLVGESGLLPAKAFFTSVSDQMGGAGFFSFPSIFWWASGDAALGLVCYAGMFFAILMIIGVLPMVSSLILWMLYLSVTVAGQIFMSYQWDNLLLEAGFLAILLSPLVWRLHLSSNPWAPRVVMFLFRLLVFKLMFMSGFVKLASGDAAWRDLSALTYHFWSQPLPVWVSWYASHTPITLLKVITVVTFFIELIVPFFIFIGRYFRYAAFLLFVGLQLGIIITGNYGFFNILTIVLCVSLLDDRVFTVKKDVAVRPLPDGLSRTMAGVRWTAAVLITAITAVLFTSMLKPSLPSVKPMNAVMKAVAPFRSINSYGLFAVMTKVRREIIIEGSTDGHNWQAYEFKYKPGDVYRTPLFATPHMPRLDWQMWFASLQSYEQNPWMMNFLVRLLDAEPDVVALLESNPFVGDPPKMIRALLYEYTFATPEENKKSFLWWNRELKGLYCPVLTKQP